MEAVERAWARGCPGVAAGADPADRHLLDDVPAQHHVPGHPRLVEHPLDGRPRRQAGRAGQARGPREAARRSGRHHRARGRGMDPANYLIRDVALDPTATSSVARSATSPRTAARPPASCSSTCRSRRSWARGSSGPTSATPTPRPSARSSPTRSCTSGPATAAPTSARSPPTATPGSCSRATSARPAPCRWRRRSRRSPPTPARSGASPSGASSGGLRRRHRGLRPRHRRPWPGGRLRRLPRRRHPLDPQLRRRRHRRRQRRGHLDRGRRLRRRRPAPASSPPPEPAPRGRAGERSPCPGATGVRTVQAWRSSGRTTSRSINWPSTFDSTPSGR